MSIDNNQEGNQSSVGADGECFSTEPLYLTFRSDGRCYLSCSAQIPEDIQAMHEAAQAEGIEFAHLSIQVGRGLQMPASPGDGAGESLGDRSCLYNAHSRYLRCAINPQGPCEGCSDFVSRPSCPPPVAVSVDTGNVLVVRSDGR